MTRNQRTEQKSTSDIAGQWSSTIKIAEGGLEQALQSLEKVPFSEMGDAESDAIRAAIGSIENARHRLTQISSPGGCGQ